MKMTRLLLIVLHLIGRNISSCLQRHYIYVTEPKNWTEAQSYCREKYTDLATVENSGEMIKFKDTVLPPNGSAPGEAWIGLYHTIVWQWSDGYEENGTEYRNWDTISNQPDFIGGDELCVSFQSGGWRDQQCLGAITFICNNGTTQDPAFVFVNQTKTWYGAQQYCRQHHTDLATVKNETDNLMINSLDRNLKVPWIGLFRLRNCFWSDGSSFSYNYNDWLHSDNILGSRKVMCGVTALYASGQWRLRPCDRLLPFVCYTVPVKRRLVKLKIQTEEASLDLNDPALKAGILEKLQEKLKENGLSGVKLKWVEQPEVFHREERRLKKKRELRRDDL